MQLIPLVLFLAGAGGTYTAQAVQVHQIAALTDFLALAKARDQGLRDIEWSFRIITNYREGGERCTSYGTLVFSGFNRRLELTNVGTEVCRVSTWDGTEFSVLTRPVAGGKADKPGSQVVLETGASPGDAFNALAYPQCFGLTYAGNPIADFLSSSHIKALVIGRVHVAEHDCLDLLALDCSVGEIERPVARFALDDRDTLLSLRTSTLKPEKDVRELPRRGEAITAIGDSITVGATSFVPSVLWEVIKLQKVGDNALPSEGRLVIKALRDSNTSDYTRVEITPKLLVLEKDRPDFHQSPARGQMIRDLATGLTRKEKGDSEEGVTRGALRKTELQIYEALHKDNLPPHGTNSDDEYVNVQCGQSAVYLMLRAWGIEVTIDDIMTSKSLEPSADGQLSMQLIADYLISRRLDVNAVNFSSIAALGQVDGVFLVHMNSPRAQHGHFSVAIRQERSLRLFDPAMGARTIDDEDFSALFPNGLNALVVGTPRQVRSVSFTLGTIIALGIGAALLVVGFLLRRKNAARLRGAIILALAVVGTSCGTDDHRVIAAPSSPLYFVGMSGSANMGTKRVGEEATHDFKLRNGSSSPVAITDIRRSCGCAQASISQNELLPGEECTVHVAIKLDGPPIHKSATVFLLEGSRTLAVMSVEATIDQQEELRFSPSSLELAVVHGSFALKDLKVLQSNHGNSGSDITFDDVPAWLSLDVIEKKEWPDKGIVRAEYSLRLTVHESLRVGMSEAHITVRSCDSSLSDTLYVKVACHGPRVSCKTESVFLGTVGREGFHKDIELDTITLPGTALTAHLESRHMSAAIVEEAGKTSVRLECKWSDSVANTVIRDVLEIRDDNGCVQLRIPIAGRVGSGNGE